VYSLPSLPRQQVSTLETCFLAVPYQACFPPNCDEADYADTHSPPLRSAILGHDLGAAGPAPPGESSSGPLLPATPPPYYRRRPGLQGERSCLLRVVKERPTCGNGFTQRVGERELPTSGTFGILSL